MTQCNIQYKVFHKSCGDNGFYGFSYGSHRITSGYIPILPYQCQAGILLGLRLSSPIPWDLRHAEQLLFLCPCSNLTVYRRSFFAHPLCASLSCLQYGISFGNKKPDNVDRDYIVRASSGALRAPGSSACRRLTRASRDRGLRPRKVAPKIMLFSDRFFGQLPTTISRERFIRFT